MRKETVAVGGEPRILYVLTAAFGLEQTLGGQLRYLRSVGFEPSFICSPGRELQSFARSEGVSGEAIAIEREIAPGKDLWALYRLWRAMRRLRPAITNVSAPKAGLLAGLAAWCAGVNCRIYTLRGLRLETAKGPKYALLWAAEWLACRLAHRVMCVGPGLARKVLELRLAPPEKLGIAGAGSSNGVDAARFAPRSHSAGQIAGLRSELEIPVDAPVLGYVGRLTRDKGIVELVAAYRLLRTRRSAVRLLLVGGFESGDPVPEETCNLIGSDPGIICTGFVRDPAPYYQLMNVLALPTYREGYPTVVLEAAAAGCPVVTTRVTGAADAVEHGETGLVVQAGDVEGLTVALESLLESPAWANRMSERAQRRACREFPPQRIWKSLEAVYREMLEPRATRWASSVAKRVLDVALCSLAVVIALPLLLLIVAAVAIAMGRPVFFNQRRIGLAGKPFVIWKIRTMAKASRSAQSGADCVTALGRLLRHSSLDELPQLWNVLRGDMSLVGPRPLPDRYKSRFNRTQQCRHDVRPGITGWSQVEGRNALDWDRRFELDLWYVRNASLRLDLAILVRSVAVVLSGAGVGSRYGEIMPEFFGETR